MTWTKNDNIGPGWKTWNPSLAMVCDKSNPTAQECPGTITGLSWGDCRYTTFNGEFYGFLNFSIANSGLYPYGGTRNHWDLALPFSSALPTGASEQPAGHRVGSGWWHTDTNPDRQGKVLLYTFPNIADRASFFFIKVETTTDQWAIDNLGYDWGWLNVWNNAQGLTTETRLNNSAWSLRRLGSSNSAWSGSAEAWSAPTPTITMSIAIRYFLEHDENTPPEGNGLY